MNTSIKINKFHHILDREAFFKRYDVFCLETSDKYIKGGAYILDASELNNDIKAIKFESGKKMFLLMYRRDSNKDKLKKLLDKVDDGEKFTITIVNSPDIEDHTIIQLLFNSLGSYDTDILKFNNLTGHLYCFHPDWIKRGKENIYQVPCLEISVNADMTLMLNVRTFTSELLRNRITFNKKKFEEYTKYVFSANNTLRRRLKENNEKCFIQRQIDGEKTEIPFLVLQSKEKFEHTKMGVLHNMLVTFNEKFDGICNLNFQIKNVTKRLDYSKAVQRENVKEITKILMETGVHLVDRIGDDYSKIFIDNIKRMLENKYQIISTVGKRVKKDKLNIMLIHNSGYYNGVNDSHDDVYPDVAVQHITFEDFSDSSEFALNTVINELIIKKDIEDKRLTLFDWKGLGFDQPIDFGIEAVIDDQNRYFIMKINPDGTFSIMEQEFTLFEMNEYTEMVEIFEQGKIDSEIVNGIIRFDDKRIYIINDTGLFTIPELGKIAGLLETGDNKLRSKERREELMASLLDIKMYEEAGEYYYFVGTIGEGMRPNIHRAACVRKVTGYAGCDVCFEMILPMMNVSFVRNGQLTVIPFPFKYLREYVKKFMESGTFLLSQGVSPCHE